MVGIIRYTISLFAIGFVSLAWAVSIYDVIELSRQGYGDEEVVNIIRSTGSVFELTAEDIPRLKNLGVSDAIIRSMLMAEPVASPETESFLNDSVNDLIEEIAPRTSDRFSHADSANYEHAASPVLTTHHFAVQLVSEEAAGDHQHVYVTLNGLPILILRDEGHFRTVENRGEAVARNLEDAIRMGEGRFKVIHAKEAEVVVYHGPKLPAVAIVTVNRHDAHAYDVRSERRVTADLLATYWAALLNDYWAITFLQQPPKRLTNLHRGDALVLLFELVYRTGFDAPVNLGLAAQQLPSAILGHLERLALAVPDDFDASSEHAGEGL